MEGPALRRKLGWREGRRAARGRISLLHVVPFRARAVRKLTAFVREVPTNDAFQLDDAALACSIADDRRAGMHPLLVVATAVATSAGVIDSLASVATLAAAEGLWFHVDSAYSAAAALVDEMRPHCAGIERADATRG